MNPKEWAQSLRNIANNTTPQDEQMLNESDAIMDMRQLGKESKIATLRAIAAYNIKWNRNAMPWVWTGRNGRPLFTKDEVSSMQAFMDDFPEAWAKEINAKKR